MLPTIDRYPGPAEAAEAAAADIAATLAAAVAARGRASLAATGGRTPAPLYRALATKPLAWDRVTVTLSDERWVDETSPDSNARLVRAELLQGPAAAARFVGLKTDDPAPAAAAATVSERVAVLGRLDCVLLGMGEDGHVASLFPGSPALEAGLRPDGPAAIGVPAGDGCPPKEPRISLTLSAIGSAGRVILFVSGESKLQVIDQALGGADFPVRAVFDAPAPVRVVWFP